VLHENDPLDTSDMFTVNTASMKGSVAEFIEPGWLLPGSAHSLHGWWLTSLCVGFTWAPATATMHGDLLKRLAYFIWLSVMYGSACTPPTESHT
jgi:hypothetical protein